jgi:pimeloyl-ACP methyl ester carboxylesterase
MASPFVTIDMPQFQEPTSWTHHSIWVDDGVKLHYVQALPETANGHTIVLIHGYPETWYAFRFIIGPLSDLGYRVLAIDYRGAGESNKPLGGYDKMTMAKDIHTLYHDALGIDSAIICGYDIGSMIAVNLTVQFEDHVEALISFGRSSLLSWLMIRGSDSRHKSLRRAHYRS